MNAAPCRPQMRIAGLLTGLVLCGGLPGARAFGDVPPETVRAIEQASRDSVLLVTSVHAWKEGGARVEGTATVVDAGGLMIATRSVVPLPANSKLGIRASEISVRLPSGGTLPMRIVLSDADLGAVVLAPERGAVVPPGAFKPIRRDDAVKIGPLDPIVIVGRTPGVHGAVPEAFPARINAVLRGPQRVYVCARLPEGGGEPAFDREGHLVGIRMAPQTIVSADDLAALIDHARSAVGGEPKDADHG